MYFRGTGGELFRELAPRVVLTAATLGIGLPWLIARLNQVLYRNVLLNVGSEQYEFRFIPSGRQLAPTVWRSALFTLLTGGLYFPWALSQLQTEVLRGTEVMRNGQAIGTCRFTGRTADIRGILYKGLLLNAVTLGAYGPWLHVQLSRYVSKNAQIRADGKVYAAMFSGQPSDFVRSLGAGVLSTIATAGVYGFWALAGMVKWQLQHTHYRLLETAIPVAEPGAPAATGVTLAQQ